MRIGIITFHRAYNCGAMLQAWALKTVLERMGHTVEFPACNHVGEIPRWHYRIFGNGKSGSAWLRAFAAGVVRNLTSIPNEDISRMRYRKFRLTNLPERACSPDEFVKYYDALIVGSDQVWSARHATVDAPLFFAESMPKELPKVVYAASYGDEPLDTESVRRVVDAVQRFAAVSVRETLAKHQLEQYTDKKISTTLDPTLLIDANDYEPIVADIGKVREPYLFMYTLSTGPFFINAARALARRLGVRCIIAPCYQYSWLGAPKGLTYGISPDRLLGFVRGAKYVLAGSFHGTVMGLLFKKPFLSLRERVDEYESRPAALLNMVGCEDRLVNPSTSLDKMEALLKQDVPVRAYELLANRREESLSWLQENLR